MNQLERYTNEAISPFESGRLHWLYHTISRRRQKGKLVRILDVGCGKGDSTIPLGLIEFSEVKGIDPRKECVDSGNKQNSLRNVMITMENLFECRISDYDFIILSDLPGTSAAYRRALWYISEYGHPLVEVYMAFSNGWGPLGMWEGFRRRLSSGKQTSGVPGRFFTGKRLRRELDFYGLEIVTVRKAYVFTPLLQALFPSVSFGKFAKADNFLAQILPKFLVSSHYYRIRKKRSHLKVVWKRN